jgi:hypothetical protein
MRTMALGAVGRTIEPTMVAAKMAKRRQDAAVMPFGGADEEDRDRRAEDDRPTPEDAGFRGGVIGEVGAAGGGGERVGGGRRGGVRGQGGVAHGRAICTGER